MGVALREKSRWPLLSSEVKFSFSLVLLVLGLYLYPPEPQVTQQEMADAKVPINLRDYCAHLFIPLMKCRKEHYYLPWKCQREKHAWDDCEFQE